MRDDSQGGLRGDPVLRRGWEDGTRDQMCSRISELEAARDHLRARLQWLLDAWKANADAMTRRGDLRDDPYDERAMELKDHAVHLSQCAADLLAVLTEPQFPQVQEKTDVTRSAETDVNRTVSLPHQPTESQP